MWVRALRPVPSIGPVGTTKNIDVPSAKALFLLGMAEPAELKPEPIPETKPKRTYRKKEEDAPKPKRVYKRKDMVAEDPVEVVAVEPEPEAKPEPESEPDGDDETAVRL